MDKRTFIKTSAAITGGLLAQDFIGCTSKKQTLTATHETLHNWSGNIQYNTQNIYYPSAVEEIQELVKDIDKIRSLGSRHSFNTIADSNANLISLKNMNKIIGLDAKAGTVTVEAGIKYGELAPYLEKNGFALHNLASLPHISVAGACATATHGSGVKNGNLSTAVVAIEFVDAAGNLRTLSKEKDGDKFLGAVVGLGAYGVVTKLTLHVQPTYTVQQLVYLNLPMQALEKNFDAIMSAGYSVSLFTDWRDKNINEVWIKSRPADIIWKSVPQDFYGAKLATVDVHPIVSQSPENVTVQRGIEGPWYERLPHFKMGFTPSAGKELQAEYFVPAEHAYEALMIMESLHEKIAPHIFISEIRSIAADELWMSPCYQQNSVAIHTTWQQHIPEVMALLPLVEEKLAPFNAKPHWAKLFTMKPGVLRTRYKRLDDFKALVNEYDPKGKFRNAFLEDALGGNV